MRLDVSQSIKKKGRVSRRWRSPVSHQFHHPVCKIPYSQANIFQVRIAQGYKQEEERNTVKTRHSLT